MITQNDPVEMKGTIASIGTDTFDVSITEIYVDEQWQTFEPPKTYTIATVDYTKEFSPSELAIIKVLSEKNKASTSAFTPDELVAINSILKKLS